jgi:aspartyl-tRNA(Asn)/glutamyl-tRNA(Gln) amidotransferase subunit A
MTELTSLGLREAARLVARRRVSPVELVDAVLARIERLDPSLNAFLTVTAESARKAARRAERRLSRAGALPPLLGVPISVKDLILTREAPTTAGSRLFGKGIPAGTDAAIVARLRRAGAILVGKTNLHEVAFGVTTVNEHFGPARNPWDRSRVAGGSSGGSAVAVAAGMGAGSVGTDTRGSIRIPAACCGIVGLKPTFGLLPTDGVIPLAPTLDHVGPMTRSVEDAALMLGAMRGSRARTAEYLAAADRKPRRLRVGVAPYYLRGAEAEVGAAVEAAITTLAKLGCPIVEVKLPELDRALEASRVIVLAEALAFHEQWLRSRPRSYGPQVRSRMLGGRKLTAVDYVHATEQRVLLEAAFHDAFQHVDVLVGAVLPTLPVKIGATSVRVGGVETPLSEAYCRFNAPQNVVGLPAMALPVGRSRSGLPIGAQVIAAWGDEAALVGVGRTIERGLGTPFTVPPV